MTLGARNATTPKDLAESMRERLGALARAHSLTVTLPASEQGGGGETPATLHALIGTIAAPYVADTQRITPTGEDVTLSGSSLTAFALLLHEFATNSAKYGALSLPGGQVDIACSGSKDRFVLEWRERGGPVASPEPRSEGFGSLLARATVQGQLGGEIERTWHADGLHIRLSVPRARLSEGA